MTYKRLLVILILLLKYSEKWIITEPPKDYDTEIRAIGLCGVINHMNYADYITYKEKLYIKACISDKSGKLISTYWWKRYDKQSRLDFVNGLIKDMLSDTFDEDTI